MQSKLLYILAFVCFISFSSCEQDNWNTGDFGGNGNGNENGDWIFLGLNGNGSNHIDELMDIRIGLSDEEGNIINNAILILKDRRKQAFEAKSKRSGGYEVSLTPGFYQVEVSHEEENQIISSMTHSEETLHIEVE